jgi:hypothetical protein
MASLLTLGVGDDGPEGFEDPDIVGTTIAD